MANVVIYVSAFCPYCRWARALLDSKQVTYTVIDVDGNPQLRQEMIRRSKRTSVPQIFIDDLHIGGFDDLSALERQGELAPLLARS